MEGLAAPPLVGAFLRITDGALLDYQLARDAYFNYLRDPDLGAGTPISARLVPYFHHVENLVTNAFRALEFCEKVRTTQPGLVDKLDWRPLGSLHTRIREMRHAIQHAESQVLAGKAAAAVEFDDTGIIRIAGHGVELASLASALDRLQKIAHEVVARLT